jgi:hypothetical protein
MDPWKEYMDLARMMMRMGRACTLFTRKQWNFNINILAECFVSQQLKRHHIPADRFPSFFFSDRARQNTNMIERGITGLF